MQINTNTYGIESEEKNTNNQKQQSPSTSFANTLSQTQKQQETQQSQSSQESQNGDDQEMTKEEWDRLVDDLFSLLRTGMSISEMELIDKLMQEINKEKQKEPMDKEKITELIEDLEEAINAIKKRILGVAIIDGKEVKKDSQKPDDSNDPAEIDQIQKAIDQLQDIVKSLKEQVEKVKKDAKEGEEKRKNPIEELNTLKLKEEFKQASSFEVY